MHYSLNWILLICYRIALPTRGGLLAQMKRLFKVYNLKFRKIKITKGHHVFWILKQTKLTYDKLLICFEVQESGHTFSPAWKAIHGGWGRLWVGPGPHPELLGRAPLLSPPLRKFMIRNKSIKGWKTQRKQNFNKLPEKNTY